MTRSRLARRLVAAGLTAAVVLLPVLGAEGAEGAESAGRADLRPPAARSLDGPGAVTVTLTALGPVVPAPGGTLTISGIVANTTADPVREVAVRLRTSPTPVRSRAELAEILAGTAGRTGISVEATRTPVIPVLAPGARAPFTFSIPFDELRLPDDNAVVVLGVESLGDLERDPDGLVQTGFARTFLPWFPNPSGVAPTRVVWLYPLTTAPSRTGDGVFLDDHLGDEIGTDGRLGRLLDAASGSPSALSWVIDPALLESLVDMADGYAVRTASGDLAPGTATLAATTWLARLRQLTSTAEVTATAYAGPDVVALHRAGLDLDIALAATTAREIPEAVLGRPVTGGLAWPPGGLADDGTLDVLRAAGARVVVLSAASLPPSPPVSYTPSATVDLATGGSPLRAVAADPALSRLVADPPPTAPDGAMDPLARRQLVLAELAMTTLELPSVSRTLVIAPDLAWATDVASTRELAGSLTASPWATTDRLDALVTGEASTVTRARADYPGAARKAELPQAFLARVEAARDDLAGLRSVAPDVPGAGTAGLESALTRTESAAWRTQPTEGRRLLAAVDAEIDAQIAQVQVLSRAPVTLPGDSGVIPVTVANDLDRPARVGVRLSGTPTVRFEAADVEVVTLAPGEKRTLEVTARVLGTGPVSVAIVLLTPEGDTFGVPVRTEVRSAAYARAAQWVVAALFGMLVVLLAINVVRRRRPAVGATSGGGER